MPKPNLQQHIIDCKIQEMFIYHKAYPQCYLFDIPCNQKLIPIVIKLDIQNIQQRVQIATKRIKNKTAHVHSKQFTTKL